MLTLGSLGARGEQWLLKSLTLHHPFRNPNSMNSPGLLILNPGAASKVSPNNSFNWKDIELPNDHGAALKLGRVLLKFLRERVHAGRNKVVRANVLENSSKPELRKGSKKFALIRDSLLNVN